MLADGGGLHAQTEVVLADLDRQARQAGALARAVRQVDFEQSARVVELRVVEEVRRSGNRGERDRYPLQHCLDLPQGVPPHQFRNLGRQPVALDHAALVGGIARIGELVVPTEMAAP